MLIFDFLLGLLLKVSAVEESMVEAIDNLLVVVLVFAFCTVLLAVGLVGFDVYKLVLEKKKLDEKLRQKPELLNAELNEHLIEYGELVFGAVLGEGAQGQVRKAVWQRKDVAVKIMSLSTWDLNSGGDGYAVAQLEEIKTEATVLSRLRHKNIVDYYGVAFDNGSLQIRMCIVLELCPRSLSDVIYDDKVALSWPQKLRYCLDIAQGMQCMHEQGIFHRDLKPQVDRMQTNIIYMHCDNLTSYMLRIVSSP